nr:hypothetical protein PHYPA_007622 [Physcomitrium patens]
MKEVTGLFGGLADSSRRCKRVTVILCAVAHLVMTSYVLTLFLGSSPQGSVSLSSPLLDFFRGFDHYRVQGKELAKMKKEYMKAAIEFRRQSAPLKLMERVKDIEKELLKFSQEQSPAKDAERTEQQELNEQVELETQLTVPAVEDDDLGVIQRLTPPEKCYPEPHTDFGGIAVRWGLTYHVNSAGECCKACLLHAAYAKPGQLKCNVWVFCPEKNGCPSPDGHEHKFGECWLKRADQPRAVVDDYSLFMRDKSGNSMPVLWISGVTPFNGG